MVNDTDEKQHYAHYGKPYEFAGKIPVNGIDEVRKFLIGLSNGIPGIGCFGTSGAHTRVGDGAVGLDLNLDALRMKHNEKVHHLIREMSKKYDIPWMEYLLLEKEPDDNLFIVAPDGEVWALLW